ncbi:MAG: hypothetical protein GY835_15520 [bacterium]|nr:hypothetical protein [bacterium]
MKIIATTLLVLLAASGAQAAILWSWSSHSGTEQGYIITDGDLVGVTVPAGSYTVLDFSVTATNYPLPIGAVSNGIYHISQPDIGFDWSGTEPTMFWRLSGQSDNGFAFYLEDTEPGDPDRVSFAINSFVVDEYYGIVYLDEYYTAVITPLVTPAAEVSLGAVKVLYR